MTKLIYPHKRPWYQRPLSCLLGFHDWRLHPSGGGVLCCRTCDGESGWR